MRQKNCNERYAGVRKFECSAGKSLLPRKRAMGDGGEVKVSYFRSRPKEREKDQQQQQHMLVASFVLIIRFSLLLPVFVPF